MSYSEENGQVVLRMSREDYRNWIYAINIELADLRTKWNAEYQRAEKLQRRLNEGTPNYTPYRVPEKKP